MSTDITPERIAEHLRGGEVFENRALAGFVDVACEGAVLRIGFTPKGKPSQIEHFRAVVVPGTDTPIVFDRATFERRINARFDKAINKLAFGAPEVWPAHIAALREQILNLDFDLEAVQGHQDGGQADG